MVGPRWWSGFFVGQGPGPDCRTCCLSAVELNTCGPAWCGTKVFELRERFFFMPKFRNVGRVALPPPIRLDVCQGEAEGPAIKPPCHCEELWRSVPLRSCAARKKGVPLRKRPNTIILPRHPGNVNCSTLKSCGFYLLYHLTANYLLEIPSCKRAPAMVD